MLHFKKNHPKASAEIHLSPQNYPTAWLSNEDVHGYAVFRLPPGVEFSHSKIALKGGIWASTDDTPGRVQKHMRTENVQFIGVTLDTTARPEYQNEDGVIKIPFRFNLNETRSRMKTCIVRDLPPSISSSDEGFKWTGLTKNEFDSQYEITYKLSASVYSKRGLQATTKQRIPVLPVSQAIHPSSLSDCPGEYFYATSTSQPSRVSWSKAPTFKLDVVGEEPGIISIDPTDHHLRGSTKIHFIAKARPRSETTFDQHALPTQCHLKARLMTRTSITPDLVSEDVVPNLAETQYGVNSNLRLDKSDEQDFTITNPHWEHYTPNSTEQFSLSRFSFAYTLPPDKTFAPTFFAPLISRRYALEVTLSFPGVATPNQRLELPVQIAYEVREA